MTSRVIWAVPIPLRSSRSLVVCLCVTMRVPAPYWAQARTPERTISRMRPLMLPCSRRPSRLMKNQTGKSAQETEDLPHCSQIAPVTNKRRRTTLIIRPKTLTTHPMEKFITHTNSIQSSLDNLRRSKTIKSAACTTKYCCDVPQTQFLQKAHPGNSQNHNPAGGSWTT